MIRKQPFLTPKAPTAFASIALAILLPHSLLASPDDWPMFRADARRTGNASESAIAGPLEVRWRFRGEELSSPRVDSSPAVSGDRVFVGVAERSVFSPRGRIVCLDAKSGDVQWTKKTRFPVFSSPSVAEGRVYTGEGYHQDAGAKLYCLDAASGEERWTFPVESHIESGPHVEKDRVYFGAGDDGVYCLDAREGEEVWHYPGAHVDVSPLVQSGLVFAGAGYGEAAIFALSAKDGKLRWRTPVKLPVWGAPVLIGNRLYFGLGNGNFIESDEKPAGAVICLAATSGKEIWQRDLADGVLAAVAYGSEKLWAASRDGHLYALRPADGEVLFRHDFGAPIVASPLVVKDGCAALSSRGRLAVVHSETREEMLRFDLASAADASGAEGVSFYSSPGAAGGTIFIGAGEYGVFALGAKK